MKTRRKHNACAPHGISAAAFSAALDRLFPDNSLPEKLAVAVSGGADSTALALLLASYAAKTGRQLTVLTVNHNLRPEAAAEAAKTAAFFSGRGISAAVFDWQPEAEKTTGIQQRARAARYGLMTQYCRDNGIPVLFLGHHADDQAETFWMRLSQGSGLDGLACMQALRRDPESGILIARPLLDFDKADLEAVCTAEGAEWINDPANTAPQFLRSRIRKTLAKMPDEKAKILQSIGLFGRLREKLHRDTATATLDCAVFDAAGFAVLNRRVFAGYPAEIRRRILQNIVRGLAGKPYPPRTRTVLNALEHLEKMPDHGVFTFGSCIFERRGERVLICREAAAVKPVPVTRTVFRFGGWQMTLPLLPEGTVLCTVLGTRGLSSLPPEQRKNFRKAYQALPRFARQALPVLEKDGKIIAIPYLHWTDSAVFGKNRRISAVFQALQTVFDEDIEIV